MKIIFCKGSSLLSKTIMWSMDEDVSHVAISFDDKIVFHSDLLGLHINWLPTFLKTHKILHEIKLDITLEKEEDAYQSIITANDGKSYDYLAFFYFAYCALKYKLFNTPIPLINPYRKKDTYLCTQVIELIPIDIIKPLDKDLSITSPYQTFVSLQETINGKT